MKKKNWKHELRAMYYNLEFQREWHKDRVVMANEERDKARRLARYWYAQALEARAECTDLAEERDYFEDLYGDE